MHHPRCFTLVKPPCNEGNTHTRTYDESISALYSLFRRRTDTPRRGSQLHSYLMDRCKRGTYRDTSNCSKRRKGIYKDGYCWCILMQHLLRVVWRKFCIDEDRGVKDNTILLQSTRGGNTPARYASVCVRMTWHSRERHRGAVACNMVGPRFVRLFSGVCMPGETKLSVGNGRRRCNHGILAENQKGQSLSMRSRRENTQHFAAHHAGSGPFTFIIACHPLGIYSRRLYGRQQDLHEIC